MKLERKVYTTRNEKVIDFVLGFVDRHVTNFKNCFYILLRPAQKCANARCKLF